MHEDPRQKAATRSWIWCAPGSAIIKSKIEGKADGTAITNERRETSFEATLENEIILKWSNQFLPLFARSGI